MKCKIQEKNELIDTLMNVKRIPKTNQKIRIDSFQETLMKCKAMNELFYEHSKLRKIETATQTRKTIYVAFQETKKQIQVTY